MGMNTTYEQQVLKLAKKLGILRSRDLSKFNIPRVVLTRLVRNGELEKVSPGLYRLTGMQISEKEAMVQVALKVPKAIFCLLTALQYHELTTQLPHEIWIALPQGSHAPRIKYPPIKVIQSSEKIYSQGVEKVICDNVEFKIYNPAKTLVDCFKHRNKIGLDIALEALKEGFRKSKVTRDQLFHYAKIARVKKIITPYIEAME